LKKPLGRNIIDGRIILKCITEKQGVAAGLGIESNGAFL
jgi:hypothetical protein